MKKALFTLAVLVMAFGNVSFAQRNAHLKSDATATILKHYGVRDDSMIVPETAFWRDTYGEQYSVAYTYDEYDYYLIEELAQIDVDGEWEDFYLIYYEYDFSGNVLEAYAQIALDGDWQNESKASYSYENGLLSEVVYQYWDNNVWKNDIKEVYNYNGNVSTVLTWYWNGNNWSSDELYTYTYGDGIIDLLIQYMQGGAWQNDEKQTFILDFDEHVTEILIEDWQNNVWVNDENMIYDFVDGVYVTKKVMNWGDGAWDDEYFFEFDYENGNAVHGTCKEKNGDWVDANGDIEMAFGYNAETKVFWGSEVTMTYVDLMAVKENALVANVKVYPVPADDEIFIQAGDFQKAEIYNVMGQKMMESLQDRVDVGELSSGLYIIKVYDHEGNCATQRFVVK